MKALQVLLWSIVLSAVFGCVSCCTQEQAVPPDNASVLHYLPGVYVIYRCDPGHRFDQVYRDGIQWCDVHTGEWIGHTGTCQKDPCAPNPCQNNGRCSTAEDPWKLGYYCFCPKLNGKNVGGKHCEIVDPCSSRPCPDGTVYCFSTFTSDKGRFCFNTSWQVIIEPDETLEDSMTMDETLEDSTITDLS